MKNFKKNLTLILSLSALMMSFFLLSPSLYALNNHSEGPRDFTVRNPDGIRNLQGNYVVGGSTNVCREDDDASGQCDATSNKGANDIPNLYIDIDNDPSTTNSSSFDLVIPDGSTVKWAGLYWQGVVHRSLTANGEGTNDINEAENDFMGGKVPVDAPIIDDDDDVREETKQIFLTNNTYGAEIVKFKRLGESYVNVIADQLDYVYLGYAGFADVTSLLDTHNPNGTYFLADIKAHTGIEPSHGNYGGWGLVVIYTNPNEEHRNITVFDGLVAINSSYNSDLVLDGFLTSAEAPINSKLAFMVMDGDGGDSSDNSLTIVSENDVTTQITRESIYPGNGKADGSIFFSEMSDVINMQPNYRTLRVDMATIELADVLGPLETSAVLQPRSGGDRYTPSFFVMSSELYVPTVCYDYSVQKNNIDITEDNRAINTVGTGDLSITVAIRSLDGHFNLNKSQLGLKLVPTTNTTFDKALYSPNNSNALVDAIYVNGHTSLHPKIAVGESVTPEGGTVKKYQRYFGEYHYTLDSSRYNGKFELDFNTTIHFGASASPLTSSTEDGSLERCEQSIVYDSPPAIFNVERTNSASFSDEDEKFPLYTQVVGKDFDFHVVAYDEGTSYNDYLDLDGVTVDLELINVTFSDENATFACNNTNAAIIQNLDSNGTKHVFARFQNDNSRVDMSSLDIQTDTALRNAAFRIYYLADRNNSLIKHECPYAGSPGQVETCFENLYAIHLQNDDNDTRANGSTGFCQTDCTNGGTDCYQCLRNYFSRAVCSRDNFAIRPAGYAIQIRDSNESSTATSNLLGTNNSPDSVATLAAGYDYQLAGIATSAQGITIEAKNYTGRFDLDKDDRTSELRFKESTGTCNDSNSTPWDIRFHEGFITTVAGTGADTNVTAGVLVKHDNVGEYQYYLHDANWTEVDQQDYAYKRFESQDCLDGSNSIGGGIDKSGCNTDTNLTSVDFNFHNLHLTYEPYRFDVSDVNISLPNNQNFVYTNHLKDDNFLNFDMSVQFIGDIIAKGKNDKNLSNFTQSCAASDVIFDINVSYAQGDNNLTENNISGTNDTSTIGATKALYLQSNYANVAGDYSYSDKNETNASIAITVASNQFLNDSNGSAAITAYYNFPRFATYYMNPVKVSFLSKEVISPSIRISSVNQITDYIPKGTADVGVDVDFYYGHIITNKSNYDVPLGDDDFTITTYVEAYCGADINCSQHELFSNMQIDATRPWYINTRHNSNSLRGDGKIISITDENGTKFSAGDITFSPDPNDVDVDLNKDSNNTQSYINGTIENRPFNEKVLICADVYLGCTNEEGNPVVNAPAGGGWVGTGNTGNVVDTNASQRQNDKRVDW